MRRDEAYLLDILLASRQAIGFLADLSWDSSAASDLHQSAVIRNLEIIGEAAGRVSQDLREAHHRGPDGGGWFCPL